VNALATRPTVKKVQNAGPYCFVGALGVRWDAATGLHYMRNRWYAHQLSAFLSVDLIPSMPEGATSRYCYASNQPTSMIDAMGLRSQPPPMPPRTNPNPPPGHPLNNPLFPNGWWRVCYFRFYTILKRNCDELKRCFYECSFQHYSQIEPHFGDQPDFTLPAPNELGGRYTVITVASSADCPSVL
jgi:RHS repeat-associated protein